MKINSNITAYLTNNALKINERNNAASNRRLSSGYKINVAGDDPTGYAVSGRMKKMIRALERCDTNAVNGQSVCETADGALSAITDIIQRMNELAVKGANGVLTSADRGYIQTEAEQLRNEIDRISNTAEFEGQALFDGTFVNKGYTNNKDIKVTGYSDETVIDSNTSVTISEAINNGKIEITVNGLDFCDGTTTAISVDYPLYYDSEKLSGVDLDADGVEDSTGVSSGLYTDANGNSVKIDADGNQYITINGTNGESISFMVRADSDILTYNNTREPIDNITYCVSEPSFTSTTIELTLTHDGAMRIQTGGNENDYIDMTLPSMSSIMLDLDDIDLSTEAGASAGIQKAKNALEYVNQARSRIGAYQNRIENSISFIAEATLNLENAVSRIEDTDMAEEMTNFTNYQVLVQAATSMLAQANESPQTALQLLQ
ncbi:flagellar hook-associated protein FlgL [Lachnospiraceae bacterium C1.1]|nr:flagellar hook-associated protein FlgL [Lachnospiraceae bacterium C1.1]